VTVACLSMSSEFPKTIRCGDVYNCQDTEFCGQDGTCHELNCINLYDYGPKTLTGHDDQDVSVPKLVCTGEPPTVDAANMCLSANPDPCIDMPAISPWPLLIHYHCTSSEHGDFVFAPLCAYEYLNGRYATLNRYCSAQPNPYQSFSCYDLDPDTVTAGMEQYLEDYVNRTRMDPECTVNNLPFDLPDNETISYSGRGRHQYRTYIGSGDSSLLSGAVDAVGNDLSSVDLEQLRFVMKSSLIGAIPTLSPTPLSMAPTNKASETAIFVAALASLIGWICYMT
jgi:hypothetical protein